MILLKYQAPRSQNSKLITNDLYSYILRKFRMLMKFNSSKKYKGSTEPIFMVTTLENNSMKFNLKTQLELVSLLKSDKKSLI